MAVKIARIQIDTFLRDKDIFLRDKKSNLEKGLKCIEEAKRKGANIVCFPELFTTGYELTLQQYLALAETMPGETTEKMGEEGLTIIGGIVERDEIVYATVDLKEIEKERISEPVLRSRRSELCAHVKREKSLRKKWINQEMSMEIGNEQGDSA